MNLQCPHPASGQENCPGAATTSAASSGAYESNASTSPVNQASRVGSGYPAVSSIPNPAALFSALSAERMATYKDACDGITTMLYVSTHGMSQSRQPSGVISIE